MCKPSYTVYEFILLLYILFIYSVRFQGSLICKRSHLKLEVCSLFRFGFFIFNFLFFGNIVHYDTDFIMITIIILCL